MGKLLKLFFGILTVLLVISAAALVVVATPLKESSIGRWLVTVPYATTALSFATTKLGFALVVVVPTLLLISSQAVVIVRDFRRQRAPTVEKPVAPVAPPPLVTAPPTQTLPPVTPTPPIPAYRPPAGWAGTSRPAAFAPLLQPDALPEPTWQAPRAHLAATRTRTDFDSVGKIDLDS